MRIFFNLSNHTQTTEINSFILDQKVISYGEPQGPVSGPLSFLLYEKDIQHCSRKRFFLANDFNVLYSNNDLKTLELTANAEMNKLFNSLPSNKLTTTSS